MSKLVNENAPLISALAQAAKATLADYAASVLAKAATYRRLVAAVIRSLTRCARLRNGSGATSP